MQILIVLAVICGGFSVFLYTARVFARNTIKEIRGLATKMREEVAQTGSDTTSELLARLASVERRVEEVEADAHRYYKKATQRMRRAESLSGEDEDDVDPEDIPQEQLAAALNGLNGKAPVESGNGQLSFSQLSDLIRSGGKV